MKSYNSLDRSLKNEGVNLSVSIADKTFLKFIFFLFAISSIVYIEPSLYDVLLLPTAFLYVFFNRKRTQYNIAIPLMMLWLFLIGNMISLFYSSQFIWSIRYFLITFYLVIGWVFFVIFVRNYGFLGITEILNGYLIAATITSIIGILSYYRLIPFYRGVREGRMISTFKDANVFAPFLIVAALYALYKISVSKMRYKIILICIFLLTLFCVFLSFSRAAYANLICSLGFYILLLIFLSMKAKENHFRYIFILLFIVISIISIYFIMSKSTEISHLFFSRIRKPLYSEIRFQRQIYVLHSFFEHPFGVGSGASRFLNPAPHNVFITILYENGILSFLGFTIFVILTLIKSIRYAVIYKNINNGIMLMVSAALIGITINSLFIDSVHWRHFWLLYAIPWGIKIETA